MSERIIDLYKNILPFLQAIKALYIELTGLSFAKCSVSVSSISLKPFTQQNFIN